MEKHVSYIKDVLKQISDREGIEVRFLTDEEMNDGKPNSAVGRYIIYENGAVEEFNLQKLEWERFKEQYDISLYPKLKHAEKFYSRNFTGIEIRILKSSLIMTMDDVMVWAHELGHHFNGDSEEDADAWIFEFFASYLPLNYLMEYKIKVEVYSGINFEIEKYKPRRNRAKSRKLFWTQLIRSGYETIKKSFWRSRNSYVKIQPSS